MDASVDFDDQAQLGTVEIRNEPIDDMLTSKLESPDTPIPQELPHFPLGCSCTTTQLSGFKELFDGRDTSKHCQGSQEVGPGWRVFPR